MFGRLSRLIGWPLAIGFVVGGVALSPLALERFGKWLPLDWTRLSEIGQSYNAVAALLAGLALSALAASVVLQVRQTRVSQLQAARTMQLELIRMAADDSDFRHVIAPGLLSLGNGRWKEHTYLNLWIMYLQMAYLTGTYSEAGIRRILTEELFSGPSGINYWPIARAAFRAEASSRRHGRFFDLVDQEYSTAISRRPHSTGSGRASVPRAARTLLLWTVVVAIAARTVRRSRV